MSLRNIFNKLTLNGARENTEGEQGKKLTPDEVELIAFQERERLDQVRRDLTKFRKQESHDSIMGKSPLDSQNILNQENVFNKQDKFKKAKHGMMFK